MASTSTRAVSTLSHHDPARPRRQSQAAADLHQVDLRHAQIPALNPASPPVQLGSGVSARSWVDGRRVPEVKARTTAAQ
jgi:hypothetical protein